MFHYFGLKSVQAYQKTDTHLCCTTTQMGARMVSSETQIKTKLASRLPEEHQ